uniref:Si:ch211-106h4.6 n=1 Tax=Gouania willdenowi TaxID=441366 RepID=A0A8C5EVN5_GOUWI
DPDLLMDEGQENTSRIDIDHVYYTSKFYSLGDVSKEFWINIDEEEKEQLKSRGFLFVLQRQPERVNLSFGFPFYGHLLKEVTVAPSGFIYTGDKIHQMLSATQYIAPLMANFNPSLTQNSSVFYFDNGTALVVQWDRVLLQNNISLGAFTFQAVLHSDGLFFPPEMFGGEPYMNITNMRATVETFCTIKEKNCFPSSIACLQFSSCGPCVTSQIGFNCSWCSRLQRCSSGFDRNRQNWVDHGCPEEVSVTDGSSKGDDEQLRTGLLAGIAVMMIVMATAVIMSIYMYTHPTSSASLFFIERRPTHWPILKFRRGSGRPSYVEVEAPGLDKDGALQC